MITVLLCLGMAVLFFIGGYMIGWQDGNLDT